MIMSVFELPTTTIDRVFTPGLDFRGNQHPQADHIEQKHRREQAARPRGRPSARISFACRLTAESSRII
jgi:hypothetical protein